MCRTWPEEEATHTSHRSTTTCTHHSPHTCWSFAPSQPQPPRTQPHTATDPAHTAPLAAGLVAHGASVQRWTCCTLCCVPAPRARGPTRTRAQAGQRRRRRGRRGQRQGHAAPGRRRRGAQSMHCTHSLACCAAATGVEVTHLAVVGLLYSSCWGLWRNAAVLHHHAFLRCHTGTPCHVQVQVPVAGAKPALVTTTATPASATPRRAQGTACTQAVHAMCNADHPTRKRAQDGARLGLSTSSQSCFLNIMFSCSGTTCGPCPSHASRKCKRAVTSSAVSLAQSRDQLHPRGTARPRGSTTTWLAVPDQHGSRRHRRSGGAGGPLPFPWYSQKS